MTLPAFFALVSIAPTAKGDDVSPTLSGTEFWHYTVAKDSNGIGFNLVGQDGNIQLNLNGTGVVPVTAVASPPNTTLLWSNPVNWNNAVLDFADTTQFLADVDDPQFTVPKPNAIPVLNLIDTLQNAGPTEKSYSATFFRVFVADVPTPFTIGASVDVKFNVTIPSGASLLLDQTAVLQKMRVQSGGSVTSQGNFFDVRTNLYNEGYFGNLQGTIEGDFFNDGNLTAGDDAEIGNLTIKGHFHNTGLVGLYGSLNLSSADDNDGTLIVKGGTISAPSTITNFGDIQVQAGSLTNILNINSMEVSGGSVSNSTNIGNFTLSGGSVNSLQNQTSFLWTSGYIYNLTNTSNNFTANIDVPVSYINTFISGTLDNQGVISHQGGTVYFNGNGTLTNEAGAVYDLQSDSAGLSYYYYFTAGTINNAGLFKKSGGTGTSYVQVGSFNNTGTIEVDSGTLYLGNTFSSSGILRIHGDSQLIAVSNAQLTGGEIIGPGTLNVGNGAVISGPLSVGSSLLRIAGRLNFLPGSLLDLGKNTLAMTNVSAADVRSYLIAGYNGGTWDGAGINSSNARSDITGRTEVGYAIASDVGIANVDEETVDPLTILVKYTYYGDSSLDGKVDLGNDFNLFLQGFLTPNTNSWELGDYNYDGVVNAADFKLFIDGYAAQGGSLGALDDVIEFNPSLSLSQKAALVAAAPEPTSLVIAACASTLLGARRRRF